MIKYRTRNVDRLNITSFQTKNELRQPNQCNLYKKLAKSVYHWLIKNYEYIRKFWKEKYTCDIFKITYQEIGLAPLSQFFVRHAESHPRFQLLCTTEIIVTVAAVHTRWVVPTLKKKKDIENYHLELTTKTHHLYKRTIDPKSHHRGY